MKRKKRGPYRKGPASKTHVIPSTVLFYEKRFFQSEAKVMDLIGGDVVMKFDKTQMRNAIKVFKAVLKDWK